MRVLVLGRDGQVARSLREAADATPVELLAVGRPDVDLDSPPTLHAAVRQHEPDVVINPAAYTAVDAAEGESAIAFRRNADAPRALAEACAERAIPLVHLSTDYVFDGCAGRPYRETDAVAPLGVYGRSKYAGEVAVTDAASQHLIIRTSWIFSPHGRNFVKTMLRAGTEQQVLRVVADQRGSPTYARHLAALLLRAAERAVSAEPPAWGVYHVCGSGATTWHGLAETVFARAVRWGRPRPRVDAISTADFAAAAPRPADSRLDTRRATATFGAALPPWEEGVAETVDALLANHSKP